MTPLVDPGLPADVPLGAYYHNLVNGQAMTWHSAAASPQDLIKYVLGLFQLPTDLEGMTFDDFGFARTDDGLVRFTAVKNDKGCAVSVWGIGDAGAVPLNRAIQDEWQKMMDELSRGEYSGNPVRAHTGGIKFGKSADDDDDAPVFDFVNGVEVLNFFDTVFADMFEKTNLDAATVKAELEKDPSVTILRDVSEFGWGVNVTIDGQMPMPATIAISGDISEEFILFMAGVDTDTVSEAFMACKTLAQVGIAGDGDGGYQFRASILKHNSRPSAIHTSLQAIAAASLGYQVSLMSDDSDAAGEAGS